MSDSTENSAPSRTFRLLTLLGFLGALAFLSFGTYSGSPRWPLRSGIHYLVSLDPSSFSPGSSWDKAAQWGMSDWRYAGGTSLRVAYNRNRLNPSNHNDGKNAWIFTKQSNASWLGITFTHYRGNQMVDCDIWFNSKWRWIPYSTDPSLTHSGFDFRSVARHETGHALGLVHYGLELANMNPFYSDANIQHANGSGMMPHGDDKQGIRFLYPSKTISRNLMATCWSSPGSALGRTKRLNVAGSYLPGASIQVPVYLENQSNTSISGGTGGVRVGIYLSTNTKISIYDTRIAEYYFTRNWPAHSNGLYKFQARIPKGMAPGTYYVGAVFDSTQKVGEQFESDNAIRIGKIRVLPNLPDLQITALSTTAKVLLAGASASITTTLRNLGSVPAADSTTAVVLSKNSYISTADTLLGTFATGILGPGGIKTVQDSYRIPYCCATSPVQYLGVIADVERTLKESNEGNNTRSLAIPTRGFALNESRLEWEARFGRPARSLDEAQFSSLKASGATLCLVNPFRKGWTYILVLSGSQKTFVPDSYTFAGISLLGSLWTPLWVGRTDTEGKAYPVFNVFPFPQKSPLRFFIHSLWFDPSLRYAGPGTNGVGVRIRR
ncbi:MAG TPA: matrixin family metalloprotease [Planctomycetes bacterium]|nr:matrixin family metalloprotease [Planctomycetota bacterium]